MSIDLRGFRDPLQAWRRRLQWQRDQAERALAYAQAVLDRNRQAWFAMQMAHEDVLCRRMPTGLPPLDPIRQRYCLAWLTASAARLQQQAGQVRDAQRQRDARRERCRQLSMQIQLGERQLQDSLRVYGERMRRRLDNEADAGWLRVAAWRHGTEPADLAGAALL